MPDPKRQLILWFISGWVVCLNGEFQNNLDDDDFSMNFTTLWDILKPQGPNPFLHELNGHWSFNDTIDISKYEDFDHTRFESAPIRLDKLEIPFPIRTPKSSFTLQPSESTCN